MLRPQFQIASNGIDSNLLGLVPGLQLNPNGLLQFPLPGLPGPAHMQQIPGLSGEIQVQQLGGPGTPIPIQIPPGVDVAQLMQAAAAAGNQQQPISLGNLKLPIDQAELVRVLTGRVQQQPQQQHQAILLPPNLGVLPPPAAAAAAPQRSGDSRASGSAYASRHQAAEQRRRLRINERLDALRKLVPHAERANTASFLEEVIKYISALKERADKLEGALATTLAALKPSLLAGGRLDDSQQLDNAALAQAAQVLAQNTFPPPSPVVQAPTASQQPSSSPSPQQNAASQLLLQLQAQALQQPQGSGGAGAVAGGSQQGVLPMGGVQGPGVGPGIMPLSDLAAMLSNAGNKAVEEQLHNNSSSKDTRSALLLPPTPTSSQQQQQQQQQEAAALVGDGATAKPATSEGNDGTSSAPRPAELQQPQVQQQQQQQQQATAVASLPPLPAPAPSQQHAVQHMAPAAQMIALPVQTMPQVQGQAPQQPQSLTLTPAQLQQLVQQALQMQQQSGMHSSSHQQSAAVFAAPAAPQGGAGGGHESGQLGEAAKVARGSRKRKEREGGDEDDDADFDQLE